MRAYKANTDVAEGCILRIAGIVNDSIVDGPGLRMTIFLQGCPHNCFGCHNPQTHDFSGGVDITADELIEKIMANPLLDGITFSGGEPFCQAHAAALTGEIIRRMGLNIVTYTGYTFEYLIANANEKNCYRELLDVTDILIDGPFVLERKNLLLHFRGSDNQRILDIKKSLLSGRPTAAEI